MPQPSLRLEREERHRKKSEEALLIKLRNHPHVPHDFFWEEYLELNPSVKKAGWETEALAIRHWIKIGIRQNLRYSKRTEELVEAPTSIVSFKMSKDNKEKKICVLFHMYYIELLDEVCSYLVNLKVPHDIYVNIPINVFTKETVEIIRKKLPHSKIIISENRGRDIGPRLELWKDIQHKDEYDIILLLHTKKSPQIKESESLAWRTNLMSAILGSVKNAEKAISYIRKDGYGIVGTGKKRDKSIGKNEKHLTRLFKMFDIPKDLQDIDYISGTMMFLSAEIFDEVSQVISQKDFITSTGQPQTFHNDGQLEHAIERIYGNIARKHNKEIRFI